MPEPFSGIVLTGGRSTRMGNDKALLTVDGQPMASRVARALLDAGALEVVCVGGDADGLRALGLRVVDDEHPDAGPLGGVVTGMASVSAPIVVVAPCDLLAPTAQPFLDLVGALAASEAQAAVPLVDGRWRPLPSALRATAHGALAAVFAAGERAVHRAIEALDIVVVDVGALPDADTPEDLPGHQ